MKGEPKTCHYCELPTNNPTRDHVFPKSKIRKLSEKGLSLPEGVDLQNNIVWACGWCNSLKGDKDYDSFKALGVKKIRHMKRLIRNKTIKNSSKRRLKR